MIYKKSWKYILHAKYSQNIYIIKAVKNFGNVKKGKLGGYVHNYHNLSQKGNCWIYDSACVLDNARVFGNAKVRDCAMVTGSAKVSQNAVVKDNARLYNSVIITDNATIKGIAVITGNIKISKNEVVDDI